MTLAELFAELKRLKLSVTLNGTGPEHVLNIEPKTPVTPELDAALREHKPAIIAYLDARGRITPSVFDEVRACLAGLPDSKSPGVMGTLMGKDAVEAPPSIESLAGSLRHIAALTAEVDELTRQLIRADVITALEARKVRGAAKIVDAALAGIPLKGEDDTAGRRLVLADIEPWPDTVDGADLLEEIVQAFTRYVILPPAGAETLALWCVHAHAVPALDLSPYLALTSPEKRCGKTTTLTMISRLVPRPVPASNITAAALFRAVEKYSPTLLIDEADTFLTEQPELRGILNSGHTRATAYAIRTVGEDHEAKTFCTFCAKAIALIKELPVTLEDRSIVLALRRKLRKESVDRIRLDKLGGILDPICRRAARWAADHLADIREADPEVPAEITSDRARDNWRPLLAIADLAGGEWRERARKAALTLAGIEVEDTGTGVLLLSDLRDLFVKRGKDRLWTKDIIEALVDLHDRPWPRYDHGKPVSHRQLGELLGPFGGRSKNIRDEGPQPQQQFKGYDRADLADAFDRYLSLPADSTLPDPSRPSRHHENAEFHFETMPSQGPGGADAEMDVTTQKDTGGTDGTDKNPRGGPEEDPKSQKRCPSHPVTPRLDLCQTCRNAYGPTDNEVPF